MPSVRRPRVLDRRTFLRVVAASSAASALAVPGCAAPDDADAVESTFPQGVGSGDPTADGVLLWTRVAPNDGAERVRYLVATDEGLSDVVASGEVEVDADVDYTVRIDVTGLAAGTTYWYRFSARGASSPVGRTRTAPPPDADTPVRIALASCQDFSGRWFHAWRALLDRDDVDLVLFVGDTSTRPSVTSGARPHRSGRSSSPTVSCSTIR
jgi:phosphodiesterase/alkaline phosphatase D-like protein